MGYADTKRGTAGDIRSPGDSGGGTDSPRDAKVCSSPGSRDCASDADASGSAHGTVRDEFPGGQDQQLRTHGTDGASKDTSATHGLDERAVASSSAATRACASPGMANADDKAGEPSSIQLF